MEENEIIGLPGVVATRTGLIFNNGITYRDWEFLGARLRDIEGAVQFTVALVVEEAIRDEPLLEEERAPAGEDRVEHLLANLDVKELFRDLLGDAPAADEDLGDGLARLLRLVRDLAQKGLGEALHAREFIMQDDAVEVAAVQEIGAFRLEEYVAVALLPPQAERPDLPLGQDGVENLPEFLRKCEQRQFGVVRAPKGASLITFVKDADGNLFEIKEEKG